MDKKEQETMIRKNRNVNFENCKYGILLEVDSECKFNKKGKISNREPFEGGFHTGMRVHFFNERGVFVGNIYEFLPYECVRFREDSKRDYPIHFSEKNNLKQIIFEIRCKLITHLIRKTQGL